MRDAGTAEPDTGGAEEGSAEGLVPTGEGEVGGGDGGASGVRDRVEVGTGVADEAGVAGGVWHAAANTATSTIGITRPAARLVLSM
jgi:hypothetical protein